jgi:hypothetical protein
LNVDVFNATKNGFTTYGKFFKTVADEIGMERALELHSSVYTDYGHMINQIYREQTVEEASGTIGGILGSMGYEADISTTEDTVVVNNSKCPEYEGYKEAGLDHEVIKKLCLASIDSIDSTLKKLGSSGSVKISKYRTGSDDYCIENFKVK